MGRCSRGRVGFLVVCGRVSTLLVGALLLRVAWRIGPLGISWRGLVASLHVDSGAGRLDEDNIRWGSCIQSNSTVSKLPQSLSFRKGRRFSTKNERKKERNEEGLTMLKKTKATK